MAFNEEWFRYIEFRQPGGVTAKELADYIGVKVPVVRNWLSKWTTKGYLKHVPHEGHVKDPTRHRSGGRFTAGRPKNSSGTYVLGDKWWGEYIFSESGDG